MYRWAGASVPYEAKYAWQYEPWGLMERHQTPLFDERFRGYGKHRHTSKVVDPLSSQDTSGEKAASTLQAAPISLLGTIPHSTAVEQPAAEYLHLRTQTVIRLCCSLEFASTIFCFAMLCMHACRFSLIVPVKVGTPSLEGTVWEIDLDIMHMSVLLQSSNGALISTPLQLEFVGVIFVLVFAVSQWSKF